MCTSIMDMKCGPVEVCPDMSYHSSQSIALEINSYHIIPYTMAGRITSTSIRSLDRQPGSDKGNGKRESSAAVGLCLETSKFPLFGCFVAMYENKSMFNLKADTNSSPPFSPFGCAPWFVTK